MVSQSPSSTVKVINVPNHQNNYEESVASSDHEEDYLEDPLDINDIVPKEGGGIVKNKKDKEQDQEDAKSESSEESSLSSSASTSSTIEQLSQDPLFMVLHNFLASGDKNIVDVLSDINYTLKKILKELKNKK